MGRQSFNGSAQWIVVDDGDGQAHMSMGQEYVRRAPSVKRMTLADNLLAAIPRIRSEKILFIEDDDWYSPEYVRLMVSALDNADIVGQKFACYYHVAGRAWRRESNFVNASLSGTGIRGAAIRRLSGACMACVENEDPFVDLYLWGMKADAQVDRTQLRKILFGGPPISVGIKGMPGRPGVTFGHDLKRYSNKDNGEMLRAWIGPDSSEYLWSAAGSSR